MIRRTPAKRLPLAVIHASRFIPSDEDYVPSYIITSQAVKTARVKIVGNISSDPRFSDDESYVRVRIDDHTDSIWCTSFYQNAEQFRDLKNGDFVQVIGKVDEWQGAKRLLIEATARASPDLWLLHRLEVVKGLHEAEEAKKLAEELIEREGSVEAAKVAAEEGGIDTLVVEACGELAELVDEQTGLDSPLGAGNALERAKEAAMSVIKQKEGRASLDEIVESMSASHDKKDVKAAIRELQSEGDLFEPRINVFEIVS